MSSLRMVIATPTVIDYCTFEQCFNLNCKVKQVSCITLRMPRVKHKMLEIICCCFARSYVFYLCSVLISVWLFVVLHCYDFVSLYSTYEFDTPFSIFRLLCVYRFHPKSLGTLSCYHLCYGHL